MKSLRLPLAIVLVLTAALCTGMLGAADQPTAGEPAVALPPTDLPQTSAPLLSAAETPAGCAASPVPAVTWSAVDAAVEKERSPLDCDCNTHEECRQRCGNENASCFIGPVCNNWPTYTGKCQCGDVSTPAHN